MKKYFILIIACLFSLSGPFYFSSIVYAANNHPQFVTNNTTYNFGTVKQGTLVEANFEIKNSGAEVLKIEKIYAACGCTAAVINADSIAPGATANLKITFDTTGFSGKKAKIVRIFSNDPKQTSVLFTVEGEIKSDISLSVQKLNFGSIQKGQERTLKFSVITDKNSGVIFKEVVSRSAYLELISQEIPDSNQKILQVSVKLKSSVPIGSFRDRIAIKSSSSFNPVINLAVFANVQGDLKIDPNILSLGLIEKTANNISKISIENKSSKKINILGADSDNENLVLSLEKKDEFHWTINTKIRENASGVLKAKIKIITDNSDENQREVYIPVYAIIKSKME